MKLKQRSVFVKWMLSYLLIMILMIGCGISIYFYSYGTVKSQSVRINQMLLEKLKLEVDGHLSDVRGVLEGLILSREVQKVTAATQAGPGQQEELLGLHRLLLNQAASNPIIADLFLYLNNTDSVISTNGHMSSRQFYDLYYCGGDTFEEFCARMRRQWKWEVFPILNSRGEKELLFVQTSLRLGSGADSATVAVSVKESALRQWFDSTKWDASVEILALDDSSQVFGRSDSLPEETGLVWHDNASNGLSDTIRIGKVSYHQLLQPSDVYNWEYILLVPVEIYARSARRIQVFTMAAMLICLLVGSYAAFVLTRAHYHPLKKVMELFGAAPMEEDKDEYRWLDAQTRKLLSEKNRTARSLKRHYLFRLLISGHEGADGKPPSFYGVDFGQPYHLVLLLASDFNAEDASSDQTFCSMSAFILENLLTELAKDRFHVECVDLGEELACIAGLQGDGREQREVVEAVLEQVQTKVREWYHFRFTAFAGSIRKNTAGIHESFVHASETAEYRDTLSGEDLLWYEDIRNRSCVYEYPIETEQKLLNMILAGDGSGASGLTRQILEDNRGRKDAAAVSTVCLMYDLLGTVIRGAEGGGAASCLEDCGIETMFSKRAGREQMEAELEALVGRVCVTVTGLQQEHRNDGEFGRKVMAYVASHYQDPALNVSIAAMAFNITPSYLSALFKEQTGDSLLESINRMRIEKAKELLSGGMSVADAARLSGFCNSSVFIRMFKKMTGITPGQMKKQGEIFH